jgi:two-component system response regulator RegX3
MERKRRVLVVEDEESIRSGLRDVLAFRGYAVESAEDGESGLRELLSGRFDLAVLDVMLPGRSGFDVCRKARASGVSLPILMLTAKGSEDDVVEGFQSGADDYVTKPFSIRELLARVEALLRRISGEAPLESFGFGKFVVDESTLLASGNGETHELTPREVALLRVFLRERGRIVSRRKLLREVWHMVNSDEVETRTVDVHIAKLRKKLDPEGRLIRTVRGAGYRFSE